LAARPVGLPKPKETETNQMTKITRQVRFWLIVVVVAIAVRYLIDFVI